MLIELHDERVISKGEAQLFLIFEDELEVSEDKELLLILLPSAYHLVQRNYQLLFVCATQYDELPHYWQESPLAEWGLLLLKDILIYCRQEQREAIFLLPL